MRDILTRRNSGEFEVSYLNIEKPIDTQQVQCSNQLSHQPAEMSLPGQLNEFCQSIKPRCSRRAECKSERKHYQQTCAREVKSTVAAEDKGMIARSRREKQVNLISQQESTCANLKQAESSNSRVENVLFESSLKKKLNSREQAEKEQKGEIHQSRSESMQTEQTMNRITHRTSGYVSLLCI